MILSDMIALTRDYIDEPTAQNWTDPTIIRFTNMRQSQVVAEIQHTYQDFFEKTVTLNSGNGTIAGVALYTLPADFIKFKRIERTDTGATIPPIDLNEKTSLGSPLVTFSPGIITGYYELDNNVGFDPVPTAGIPISMTYVYRLADMVATTDTSAIPAEFHHLLSIGAAIDCFIKDEADTSRLDGLWAEGLDRLHRVLRERQSQSPRTVRRVATSNMGSGLL